MWRVIVAASMLLTLALGSLAQASPPPIVIESVTIEKEGGGATLRFLARFTEPFDDSAFPDTATAVVMQQDGQRAQGKCLNVSLLRTDISSGLATYVGRFNFLYQGASTLAGRADLGGSIYDFSAPLDGTPGTVSRSSYQGAINGAAAPAIVTAPVTITPDPATRDPRLAATAAPEVQPAAVAQPAPAGQATSPIASLIDSATTQPVAWLGLIVILVAVTSAYFDRRRSLARTTAS